MDHADRHRRASRRRPRAANGRRSRTPSSARRARCRCCTAMMSARGTITSSTRRSRRPRMFLSIVRSFGEKPVSPAPSSSTSLRSARIDAGLPAEERAQRPRQPAVAVLARDLARARHRHRQIARLARRRGRIRSDWVDRNRAWRSECQRLGVARNVGVGHAEPGQNRAFPAAPWPRPPRRSRGRSRRDEEIHAPPDGRDDARTACPPRAPRAPAVS